MAASTSSSSWDPESTFRGYNKDQGQAYASIRPDYHPSVYNAVLSQHAESGGQQDTMLDIGCGPGNAVRELSKHFAHAYGLDPSEGMIAHARTQGGVTASNEPVRFEVSTAEELGKDLDPPVRDGSVDLVTAATAAHWFDLDAFWPAAARVLKPGGSVAIWITTGPRIHPSVPNAVAIQALLDDAEENDLRPYIREGNDLSRDAYVNLPLPWTISKPETAFDEGSFARKEWDLEDDFLATTKDFTLDQYEKLMSTSSPVHRWRDAHPDDVGTERDVIKILRKGVEKLLHEAGVEEGKETLRGAVRGAMLFMKKKA